MYVVVTPDGTTIVPLSSIPPFIIVISMSSFFHTFSASLAGAVVRGVKFVDSLASLNVKLPATNSFVGVFTVFVVVFPALSVAVISTV